MLVVTGFVAIEILVVVEVASEVVSIAFSIAVVAVAVEVGGGVIIVLWFCTITIITDLIVIQR